MCENKTQCGSCTCADSRLSPTQERFLGILIDHANDERLTDQAKELLTKFYLKNGESIQHGYGRACVAWSTFKGNTDTDLAQRLYSYVSKGWFGFASPVLSNAPLPGEAVRGLPISCFAGYVPDTIQGLLDHSSEFRWLSIMGGGYGSHWSDVRSVSDKAPGPIPFIRTMDADAMAYKQGSVRRGSYVAYLDISHPDILEFMQLRVPTGDSNRKCLGTGFHNAVNITDAFMEKVIKNEQWDLIDPADKQVRESVSARELWEVLLETRSRTGEPYLCFIDTANRFLPEAQKALGLKIRGSNLCSEIMLATGIDYNDMLRTFVCCLSSINLEMFSEWGRTPAILRRFVGDLIRMLDNVLEYFIENAPDTIESARYSAIMERAIGLGTMGLHGMLQKMELPFDSEKSIEVDEYVHRIIKHEAVIESRRLAAERGEPDDMKGTGLRHSHLMANAPTANNATIVGTTASTDLVKANAYAHRTRAGTHLIKNKYLEKVLDKYGMNTDEIWSDIMSSRGSVQHLDFLTEHEKKTFKTAIEVDQMWVIRHASARQQHICQGQSINLFFPPGATKTYINRVHIAAWKQGLKSLYYYRTEASSQAENVSRKLVRDALADHVMPPTTQNVDESVCSACEG